MKNIVLLWHNNNNSTEKHIKCSLFFTIFRLTMVSSVMDCIGNRNLRQRSSKVNHVCCNVSKHVLMWVFRPCIVHFYVITFVTFTFADFGIISFFELFHEALLPLSVVCFLGRHGLLNIKHLLKWNQFIWVCPLTNHMDQLCQWNVIIRVTFFFTVYFSGALLRESSFTKASDDCCFFCFCPPIVWHRARLCQSWQQDVSTYVFCI